ncbi:DUF6460 domain-containing protein [Govanella unica]|uniref:DUF6460 domain-containing protein n=1 Tax=Govanella unica TaxID=2975056 RepID=A0A9X3Z615_9PROT|nr:hypothetical protein [Govania unica]MDA5192469.1 hypothetical protein [Govania unica]
MNLPEITTGKIIGLIGLCFIAGFVLTTLGIRPDDFWSGIVTLVQWLLSLVKAIFADGFTYLLVGAAVVLPIYAVVYLWKAWRKK